MSVSIGYGGSYTLQEIIGDAETDFSQGEGVSQGGGGTDFCPALDAIDKDGNAVCIVCITDLDGTLPDTPPAMPVIWLCTTDNVAPFGETVPLDR